MSERKREIYIKAIIFFSCISSIFNYANDVDFYAIILKGNNTRLRNTQYNTTITKPRTFTWLSYTIIGRSANFYHTQLPNYNTGRYN